MIPAGQHDPFGAGAIAIARGLRPSGSRKPGDRPWVFVSDKRPKFTAKARSSPSLRTRQEDRGADQPILNRKKRGLSLGFFLCLFLSELSAFAVSFDGLSETGPQAHFTGRESQPFR